MNTHRNTRIIVLAVLIALALAACDSPSGGGGYNPADTDKGTDNPGGASPWKPVRSTELGAIIAGVINYITYGNGIWVAVGRTTSVTGSPWTAAYSTDNGETWQASATDFSTLFYASHGIVLSHNGTDRFLATGDAGGPVVYSTDGNTWTTVTDESLASALPDIFRYISTDGNGRWLAEASGGYKAYSSNGVNWTSVTTSDSAYTNMAFGNGRWMALSIQEWEPGQGNNYKTLYSDNIGSGNTWSTGPVFQLTGLFNYIAYGGDRWLVREYEHQSGKGYFSTDNGATWTAVPAIPNMSDGKAVSITYGNGRWLAIGVSAYSSPRDMYDTWAWSTDLVNWTPGGTGIITNLNTGKLEQGYGGYVWKQPVYGNGRWIVHTLSTQSIAQLYYLDQ